MATKPVWCRECNKPYQAHRRDDPCPHCANVQATCRDASQGAAPSAPVDQPVSRGLEEAPALAAQYGAEERDCPRCAERVKIKARACRFCGHELVRVASANESGSL